MKENWSLWSRSSPLFFSSSNLDLDSGGSDNARVSPAAPSSSSPDASSSPPARVRRRPLRRVQHHAVPHGPVLGPHEARGQRARAGVPVGVDPQKSPPVLGRGDPRRLVGHALDPRQLAPAAAQRVVDRAPRGPGHAAQTRGVAGPRERVHVAREDEVEARGVDERLEALAEALPGQAVGLVRVGVVPVFVFCFCSGMEMKEERERERERKKWRERERKVKSFLFGESKFCSLSLSLLFRFSLSHSTPARKA